MASQLPANSSYSVRDMPPEFMYFAASWVIAVIVLGLSGNLLTIVSVLRSPKLRTPTSTFIINLCVADLLFCVVNLPFSASRFIHRGWVHGDSMCVIFPFLRYVNVGVSLLSIAAISVNRYILIVHQPLYDRVYNRRNIATMIAFIWVFSVSMVLPTLLGKWGKFGFDPSILNCSILEVNGRSAKSFLFFLGFLVPCFAIILCYSLIFWVLHKSRHRVLKHRFSSASDKDYESKKKREEWKITRMVLIIFCSFFLCYLPITILKVADKRARYLECHIISYLLIYMSACINPVIYGVTNRQYRQAYKLVLLCRTTRPVRSPTASHTRHDSSGCGPTVVSTSQTPSHCDQDSVFEEL